MMALYSIGRRTTNVTTAQAAMDIVAGAGAVPRLMEWGVSMGAATASIFGLNRPTAVGTRTSPVALLLESEPGVAPAAEVDSAIAHSVQPTFATDDIRRIGLPGTIGSGVIWQFPRGVAMAVSTSLCVRNLATNGVADSYAVADE
jgi:hypothetical protein